ncbi:MAG: FecR domain-containing protein [Chitinispirillaceae bacterium]
MALLRNFSHKLALFVLFTCIVALCAQQKKRYCTVKTMVGTVKIQRARSTRWRNARLEMPLGEKDAVRTLLESKAELETSEGTTIRIGENTTMELETLQNRGKVQNTKLKVLNGSVTANVKKLINTKSDFTFETPTATAAIRGTVLDLNVTSSRTVVRVLEGKVWVAPLGSDKGVELSDQQMTVVEKGQKDVEVMVIPEDSMQNSSSTEAQTDSLSVPDSTEQQDSLSGEADSVSVEPDDELEQDSSEVGTSQEDTLSSEPAEIGLELFSPRDNSSFSPGQKVNVTGKVYPSKAKVIVNGKAVRVQADGVFKAVLDAPTQKGNYRVKVLADYASVQKTEFRQITISQTEKELSVISPVEGQVLSEPLVKITGKAHKRASVTVAGIEMNIAEDGTFSGEIPLPDEEGEKQLEIEMRSESGESEKLMRRVIYKPQFRFVLQAPAEDQTFYSTNIPLKGILRPSGAELFLNGKRIPVNSDGSFSAVHAIPDEEGEVRLEFEVNHGKTNQREIRTVNYKRPADMYKPVMQGMLPEVSRQRRLAFTVIDRTPDEEIIFHSEKNGLSESERGPANSPFYLELQEGIHSYTVYAEDKFGNQTPRLKRRVAYLESSAWHLVLRNPPGDKVIHIPPSAPDLDFKPRLTVELSIEKLPEDNPDLIREVVVINTSTGKKISRKSLTSIDVDCEIVLDRKRPNKITVQVRDINDIIKTRTFTVHIR